MHLDSNDGETGSGAVKSASYLNRARAKASLLSPPSFVGGVNSFCTNRTVLGDEAFILRRHVALWACGRGLLGSRDLIAKTLAVMTGKTGPDWRQASSTKQGARDRSKDNLWDEARGTATHSKQGVDAAHGDLTYYASLEAAVEATVWGAPTSEGIDRRL
jgi:hypothetical protein